MGRPSSSARWWAPRPRKARAPRWRLGPRPARVPRLAVVLAAASACALAAASPLAGLAAALAVLGGLAAIRLVQDARATRGWVVCGERCIARVDRGGHETALADWDEPFGVTVLANHGRTRCLLAFTTAKRTRFLPVRTSATTREETLAVRALLAQAGTVADADVMRAVAPAISAPDASDLLAVIAERASRALGRLHLTGAGGQDVVLEEQRLRCGESVFDLRAPLEWRGFLFHESLGATASVYQATWVRQGGAEVVLVAPLPPEIAVGGRSRPRDGQPPSARDLRLMQSAPGEPPPRALRVAVERVFMLPLRQALDRAPRAKRGAGPASRLSSAHG